MRRREKEVRDRAVLEKLLRSAPVCRIGLAPATIVQDRRPQTGPSGYPYVVPLHFVYKRGRIYIHSATVGKKIAMLAENSRVCVEIDEFLGLKTADKACDYGTRFRSLIAFGRARIVDEPEKKLRALELLMKKYSGRSFKFAEREIAKVTIIEIRIDEVTGKQG